MDIGEYRKQKVRIEQYDSLEENKSGLEEWKTEISRGVYSITCSSGYRIYEHRKFGEGFFERLGSNLCNFLDNEISAIEKAMEDV